MTTSSPITGPEKGYCEGNQERCTGDGCPVFATLLKPSRDGANTRHEELWGGPVRTESKAGLKAKTVATAYNASRAQSEAARPTGDVRPFVASFCPDGSKHTLFVIRDDDLETAVFAMAEAWGFGGAA